MNLTRHFTIEEMSCPCCHVCLMDPIFMDHLEALRARVNHPLRITSGYRCAAHNAACGGAENSAHCLGKAVDISIAGPDAAILLVTAINSGFSGFGIRQHGSLSGRYLHIDIAHAEISLWTYS